MENKKLLDKEYDISHYNRYIEFLTDRREIGVEYTKKIMKVLLDARNNDPMKKGWVRSGALQNMKLCPEATLFRLLKALTKNKIITQNKRENHNQSSYCLPKEALNFYFWSEEEALAERIKISRENEKMMYDLMAAHAVLYRHQLLDEYAKEKENFWKLPED